MKKLVIALLSAIVTIFLSIFVTCNWPASYCDSCKLEFDLDDGVWDARRIASAIHSVPNMATAVFRGNLTDNVLSYIGTSLEERHYEINLDLGECTGLDSLPARIFKCCYGLVSISIPSSVTKIGHYAFLRCSSLRSVTISSGLSSIGLDVFDGCSELNLIAVDTANVHFKDIDGVLFSKDEKKLICYPPNKKETFYEIPASVTDINNIDFDECRNLLSIMVDAANVNFKDIDGVLFSKDGKRLISYPPGKKGTFYEIPSGVTAIEMHAFSNCTNLTAITIPSGIDTIGYYAFYNCIQLESVTIPSSVKSIGDRAFCYCRKLMSITVDTANGYYKDIDGVLFSKDERELICYPSDKKGTSYEIPDGVTWINSSAFCYSHNLTSITMPRSLMYVYDYAFLDCFNLALVNYSGTSEQWLSIIIYENGNSWLLDAIKKYDYVQGF
ncbi:MAG: leucine-rich repeat protein [Fibrobacter sp.]|nr:leucine-rich repeat protein [Fibrobacter sp.]